MNEEKYLMVWFDRITTYIISQSEATFAARQGFEPRFLHPECSVLPLHHQAMTAIFYLKMLKYKNDSQEKGWLLRFI